MYDVIISGCGPAGSNAAYKCATAGLKVLMIDKDEFPRKKCCAGGLLERACSALPNFSTDLIEKEIYGAKFVMGDESLEIKSDKRVAVTVKRESFDTFLFNSAINAGVESITGHRVTKAIERDDCVDVTYGNETVSSKLFIVADGASSRVANSIFGAPSSKSRAVAIAQNLNVEKDSGNSFVIYTIGRSPLKPKLKNRFPSYAWAFPKKNQVNIGVGGVGYPTEYLKQSMDRIYKHVDSQFHVISDEEAAAHSIPYAVRDNFCTKRCMAVGDAAGFASSLSGEGFTYAIFSGLDAGMAAVDFINHGSSIPHGYRSRLGKDVLPYLRSSNLAARLVALSASFCNVPSLVREFSSDHLIQKTCIEYVLGKCDWTKLFFACFKRFPKALVTSFGRPWVPQPPII